MNIVRSSFLIAAIVVAAIVFFLLLYIKVSYDLLAMVLVLATLLMALKDKRYLLAGWFLFAPYFNSLEPISNNVTHNLFGPFMCAIVLGTTVLRHRRLAVGKEDVVFLLFLLFAIFSVMYFSGGSYVQFKEIYVIYFLPFLFFSIVKNVHFDDHFIRVLALVSIFHLVVLTVICYFELRSGTSLFTGVLHWTDVGRGRIAGPLGTPFTLGVFVCLLFLYIYLACALGKLPRATVWLASVPSGTLLFWTYTRSVWVGAVASGALLLLLTSRRKSVLLARLGMFAGLIALVAVYALSRPEVAARAGDETNVSFRFHFALASIRMFLDNPLLGVGIGNYNAGIMGYFPEVPGLHFSFLTSHMTYLTILVEQGLLGTTLFLLFNYFAIFGNRIRLEDLPKDDRFIIVVNIVFLVAFFANAVSVDMRYFPFINALVYMSFGVIQNVYRKNSFLTE